MLLIGLPLALLITTMVEPCDEGAIHAAGRAAAGVAAPYWPIHAARASMLLLTELRCACCPPR
ncbi:hypothetical protein PR003_g19099 [Phytophthora rubi]|uniref:Uncharacterized protein n=1 Tax=Phytophthora rubi TaxID=129364 RepID=A0A6A4EAY0_9STRA|nr:hypothetical protein PR003_g19099 [Phytophthora rubi]